MFCLYFSVSVIKVCACAKKKQPQNNSLPSNPYALKDGGSSTDMSAWTSAGLQTTPGYYPYDPTLAAYG
ncbi:hypothetical protein Phum_PHUM562230 [Pediculus humanus corporis]|uniref:Uncharacterized protein n=1 Tax=Pediculus humanus subsp. corporis TaxID=121224 RepID=E0W0R1_PEDHC|nr:uncharacterized protein Phum_PHUM562230 [Pediculus humanus corporis]EEB19217.1 hypothetical protein Phum_PHUM562230 [Pediculus humanus corporis]